MAHDVVTIDEHNLDAFVQGTGRVKVLRFWASWCRPCIALEPVFSEIADELTETAEFGEVDIDKAPQIAQSYGIRSVPSVVVLSDGQPVEVIAGLNPKDHYSQVILRAL